MEEIQLEIIIGMIIFILKKNFLWVNKIKRIQKETDSVFVYFNNHYSGKAIVNALQFKEMINNAPLLDNEKNILDRARKYQSSSP